ncbi:MAG: LuxR C-terminal-related transcriptional regulator, partial [Pseudomonadota bacterium]
GVFMQSADEDALEQAVDALLEEVTRAREVITLILDDYHLAESPASNRVVLSLVRGAPRNFSVVLAGRTVPTLDLSPLRLRGQLAEIETLDLRFNDLEAEEFLTRSIAIGVAQENLVHISHSMDGWAMGLQVAAISNSQTGKANRFVDRVAFDGSDISHFLATEILGVLPGGLTRFLEETAHLEILTPELCDVSAGRSDSAQKLAELVRLNLFVQSMGGSDGWYRYHHLFRSFLRRHFKADDAPENKARHERAFTWLANHGHSDYAIQHALEAGLWSAACDTIETIWKPWLSSSRYEQLQGWISQIPERLIAGNASLQTALAWTDTLKRRLPEARDRLDRLIETHGIKDTELTPESLNATPTIRNILVLKGALDTTSDNSGELVKLADIEMAEFEGIDRFSRVLLLNYILYARVLAGKFDQANRLAEVALREQVDSGHILVAIHGQIFAGLGRKMTGDLPGAMRAFSKASDLSSEYFGFVYSAPQSLLASVYYEWADLSAAERCLDQAQRSGVRPTVVDPVIAQWITAAKIAQARQGVSRGLEVLAEAERLGREDGSIRLLLSALSERVRLLIASGQLEEALDIETELIALAKQRQQETYASWPFAQSLVAQAQALIKIAQGQAKAAQSILTPYLVEAQKTRRTHPWIKLSILDGLACIAGGREKAAVRKLSQAIAAATQGRYVRAFVDDLSTHRSVVSAALTRCALDGIDHGYLTSLSDAFDIPLIDWASERTAAQKVDTTVDITSREKDLLLALSAGMTNKSIARDVGISENTVAWHLKNLFQKLGAANRTAAVVAARKHGLLD